MSNFIKQTKQFFRAFFGIRNSGSDPYHERSAHNWNSKEVQIPIALKTLGGFKIAGKMSILLVKTDPLKFRQNQMLDDGAAEALALTYETETLDSCQQKFGFFAFMFSKPDQLPVCHRYSFSRDAETGKVSAALDLNAECFVYSSKSTSSRSMNGCQLSLVSFEQDVSVCIEENYAMFSHEERQQATQDAGYKYAVEVAAIAALQKRQEIREGLLRDYVERQHENEDFSVHTEIHEGSIRLTWELKRHLPEGGRLIGVRQTGGFEPEISLGMRRGVRISDSDRDGFTVEYLEPETTFYYTFAIEIETWGNVSNRLCDRNRRMRKKMIYQYPLRFSIRVPSARDNKLRVEAEIEMKKLLDQLHPPSPREQQIKEVLGHIETYQSISNLLGGKYALGLEEIKASSASEVEKKRQREAWETLFDQLRMTYGA